MKTHQPDSRANVQPPVSLRDRLWLWAHPAGSHDGGRWGLNQSSRITPAEAAGYMGIPNVIMVKYNNQPQPPYDQLALALSPLRRVVWSILGDAASDDNLETERILSLARQHRNITGVMMDDFFQRKKSPKAPDLDLAPCSPEELAQTKEQLALPDRKLDLWVVLYAGHRSQMDLPIQPWLTSCDVITLWTMQAGELAGLEQSLKKVESLSGGKRIMLGCYLYDYGAKRPIPLDLMKYQCEHGLQWITEKRIDGMIFLASCICDLGLEAVEWTRQWIRSLDKTPGSITRSNTP